MQFGRWLTHAIIKSTQNIPAAKLAFKEKAGSCDQEDSQLPGTSRIPRFVDPKDIVIVVMSEETLPVFQAGNLKYMTSAIVDKWR